MKNRGAALAVVGLVSVGVVMAGGGCARWKKRVGNRGAVEASKVAAKDAGRFAQPGAVEDLTSRAAALLETLATDANPQVRANALEGLAENPGRLEPLIGRALVDTNPGVRSAAAMMVGKIPLRSAAPATRVLLKDSNEFVRASAIYAMVRCGETVDMDPLATMLLSDPSPRVRAHVAYLLGELGEPSAMGLLKEAAKAVISKAPPSEVRLMQLQFAEAMVKLGDDSQAEVIRAALYPSRPEDLEATALAVQIIGQIRDRGAIDQLIYMTAYRDAKEGQMPAEIRIGAVMSLARMGRTEGSFVVDEYAASPVPVLRAQSALAYGQIGRTENLGKLEAMMQDPEPITRVSAAAGVLRTGSALAGHPSGN